MSNARGSGSGSSATSTHSNGNSNGGLRVPPPAGSGSGGGGSSCGSGSTTVGFYQSGSGVMEEVNCQPTSISIPILVTNPHYSCPVSVKYATQDGTAYAGTDYTAVNGTATIPANSNGPFWVNISILDDGTDESVGSDYFYLNLSSPVNAKLSAFSQFVVHIEEGPVQKASDQLEWKPCVSNNSNDRRNWYDLSQGFQLQQGALGPNPSSPIIFDGSVSNSPINWFGGDVASIDVGNGYNAQMTFENGSNLTVEGTLITPA
jgi:hypothetical protein